MPDSYPSSRRDPQIDDYHGTEVADPYRWLEQPADTPEVREWIEAQNARTRSYFDEDPLVPEIRQRLGDLWNFPRVGAPVRRGDRYFQLRNSGLQKQDVLFVMERPDGAGRVLLDPNALSNDGRVALTATSASHDGEFLAYGVSEAGSDWTTWHVRRVATGEDIGDTAHAAVGVFDMLRYHLFTIGFAWASDFGRADDPAQFPFLHAYSPLHNVRPGTCYPPTLLTTGDHDDRVVPAHTFKFGATLQAAQGCDEPVLVRIETRAGHGAGKPTDAIIDEYAEIWAFLLAELGVEAASETGGLRKAMGR